MIVDLLFVQCFSRGVITIFLAFLPPCIFFFLLSYFLSFCLSSFLPFFSFFLFLSFYVPIIIFSFSFFPFLFSFSFSYSFFIVFLFLFFLPLFVFWAYLLGAGCVHAAAACPESALDRHHRQ
jgi:hypothetical protein